MSQRWEVTKRLGTGPPVEVVADYYSVEDGTLQFTRYGSDGEEFAVATFPDGIWVHVTEVPKP